MTEAMLKAAEWRENNPDGLVGTLDGFIHNNYCISCGINCVSFNVNKNCETVKAILKIIEWKDAENKRCGEFLGIFFCILITHSWPPSDAWGSSTLSGEEYLFK